MYVTGVNTEGCQDGRTEEEKEVCVQTKCVWWYISIGEQFRNGQSGWKRVGITDTSLLVRLSTGITLSQKEVFSLN